MDGSSESGWQGSDSSRGFTSPAVSDKTGRHRVLLDQRDLHRARDSLSRACEDDVATDSVARDWGDVSLRQWLDNTDRAVDAIECVHIFSQIVEIVNAAHLQGIAIHNVRPSCFVVSSSNHVSFIESASCSDSGSDSLEDGSNNLAEGLRGSSFSRRLRSQFQLNRNPISVSRVVSESSSLCQTQSSSGVGFKVEEIEEKKHHFPMNQVLAMETNWYTSPEESGGVSGSCASDIYRLGVLLFELFCTFSSVEEKSSTMSSLKHRVLPPQLLLKWPKEASFCLWLLHPDPGSRPKMSELLQNEFLNEPRDGIEELEAAIEISERLDEQELLLEFLLLVQRKQQEAAVNLQDTISYLSSDIEEATKQQSVLLQKGKFCSVKGSDSSTEIAESEETGCAGSRKRYRPVCQSRISAESSDRALECRNLEQHTENQGITALRNSRLMKNFKKLESAYFLTRQRAIKPPEKSSIRHSHMSSEGRRSVVATERSSIDNFSLNGRFSESRQSGWINSFLEGLCKYLCFSKVKVKADLKQGDLLNSSNLVCSLGFDRDGEFFATAGMNKKIKVFEYSTVLNDDCDIHYPVVELASRSKLSSICWNGYIKSQIASSNFEGTVQVWDATRGQVFMEMKEHERRAWSVDFSLADPTMMASGSDDGSVKLWSINQAILLNGASIATIKTKANVCCVQFPADSGRSLAFGSADHRTYYYDLRNLRTPLCTLIGHTRTVSYVKFIGSSNLVSASTDNTLKLWDLSACTSRVLDCPLQSFTGHTNVKNFVGLSVSDGYIATGSEMNEVFIYHKSFPMPALSFKFGSSDPLSGADGDEPTQFISSVCFRGQSPTLIAANSTGNIKLLDMV